MDTITNPAVAAGHTARMKLSLIAALALAGLSGCNHTNTLPPDLVAPIVIDAPVEFTLFQRSTTALPGSNGSILITIDYVTRKQVMTSVAWQDGVPIVAARSMRPNDELRFTVRHHTYQLKLEALKNALFGEDRATFRLSPATNGDGPALSEDEKIEALIASLEMVGAGGLLPKT